MKKYLILFISVFSSFFLINKVKAEVIEFTIPNTEVSFSYDLDTDRYPYYIGNIHTQAYNNTIYLSLYYFDNPYIVSTAQQSSTCMPVDNNYPQISCYLSARKQDNTRAYWVYYKYSTVDGHLIETNNNNPTFQYTYDNVILSYYNYYDYIENISSFNYINDIYPNFGTPVGWILSDSITSPQTDYTLTPSYINSISAEPDYNYEIMEGSDKGKRVLFEFENFSENSYISVVDMSSGSISRLDNLSTNDELDLDNITYDSIFYYEIYNNDELFDSGTINVYSDFLATGQPVVRIDMLTNVLTSVLTYEELKDDYKLYYAINDDNFINLDDNPENLEIADLGESRIIYFPNTGIRENNNYVLRGRITDSNGRILYDIGYNVIFFPDKPYFSFTSSYNSSTGANEVEITLHNFESNDIVYYSFDNINFTQFDNINVNNLVVYSDTDIYTKVIRGNDTYYGFYHVNLNGFNNSSNSIYDNSNGYDDNLFTGFKNLFTGVDMSFLSNISTFFNALKGSYVFRFVMLCITGALILFIMRMIRR